MPKCSSNSQTQMPPPLFDGDAGVREVTATPAVGHHGKHPHSYRVGEGAPQGDELLHPFLGAVPADAVLLNDPEFFNTHSLSCSVGFQPLMKALASRTSLAAAVASMVSPQHPVAEANSCS